MEKYVTDIIKREKNTRIALSKQFPFLLPIILESKRFLIFLRYTLGFKFRIRKSDTSKWFNLVEHSSPLYRKYNKKILDEGKINNIQIAIKKIDGLVIPPGHIFSFWKFVGRTSKRKGFKDGLVLANGSLEENIGGGLCQLSNLIEYMFGCTECSFVERKHHSKDVFPDSNRTVPFASGATVFFNLIDLKIKNTYPFPIKINLRTTDTQLRGSVSAPNQLNYFIKLKEENPQFIKSVRTGTLYRCNEIYRIFYSKNTKQKIKEYLLWKNIAEVMYGENEIKGPVSIFE